RSRRLPDRGVLREWLTSSGAHRWPIGQPGNPPGRSAHARRVAGLCPFNRSGTPSRCPPVLWSTLARGLFPNAQGRSLRRLPLGDAAQECRLFGAYEAFFLGEAEVCRPIAVGLQALAVGLVGGEALAADQAVGDAVLPLVRRPVALDLGAARRDDRKPVP